MSTAMREMMGFDSFPLRNQLKDVPKEDGYPDNNAREDCVPTCDAAVIEALRDVVVAGDDLKDAVYGHAYEGGTSESAYRQLLRQKYALGVSFVSTLSASQALINAIREALRARQPAIVTMHSHWNTPWAQDAGDGLHAGVAYRIDASDEGQLHIMNPWGGFDHVHPVAWWRERLGEGIYPIAKLAQMPEITLPSGWSDDGTTLHCANGQPVVKGFRDYVREQLRLGLWRGGDAYGPEWLGPDGRVRQVFADALLITDLKSPVREGTLADVCALAYHEREGKVA